MKILVLSPIYPLPPDNGAKRRILGFLNYFSVRHDVTFAALNSKNKNEASSVDWKEVLVKTKESKLVPILRSAISKYTYREVKFWEQKLLEKINSLLKENEYDLIWVNQLNMCRYLEDYIEKSANKPLLVLDQHNVDSDFWGSFKEDANNPLVRTFAAIEHRKAIDRQLAWYPLFDVISSVSDSDHELAKEFLINKRQETWTVPNGVDIEFFVPPVNKDKMISDQKIIFTGSMDAYMNQEAVTWFAKKVWPRITKRFPGVIFYIVGRDPSEKVKNLGKRKDIVVTGSVPDVKTFMTDADIAVIPIHLGGGTKLKTLEAMAMGLPIVSTREGIQGLSVIPQEHLLVAEDPEEFSEAICSLLTDRNQAYAMGLRAQELIKSRYSWKMIYRNVEKKIESMLGSDL